MKDENTLQTKEDFSKVLTRTENVFKSFKFASMMLFRSRSLEENQNDGFSDVMNEIKDIELKLKQCEYLVGEPDVTVKDLMPFYDWLVVGERLIQNYLEQIEANSKKIYGQ